MLRSFRVGNHRSIREEAELLLMPAYDKARPVVPVAAIFGANASGKSNLLDALRWMQAAVRDSFASWGRSSGVPRLPYLLDREEVPRPSLYVVEIEIDEVRHTYGFTVDDERVREEWLYSYPHNRKRVVFERDGDAWTFGTSVPRVKTDVLRELTRENSLFLSVAGRSDVDAARPVLDWFERSPIFSDPRADLDVPAVARFFEQGEHHRTSLIQLVRAADLGIHDIVLDQDRYDTERLRLQSIEEDLRTAETGAAVTRSDLDAVVIENPQDVASIGPARARFKQDQSVIDTLRSLRTMSELRLREIRAAGPALVFLHGEDPVALAAGDQSFGTLAWLRLLVPTLTALEHGAVLCVDEIDSSLHPRLTARLIELFRSEETNPRHAQLILTTHDATLLGTSFGEDILARDEVWFVEKDTSGGTKLFALSDFKPRKEENTERRYLGGSYGAVPAVYSSSLVQAMHDAGEANRAA
jgi:hypothetical protein